MGSVLKALCLMTLPLLFHTGELFEHSLVDLAVRQTRCEANCYSYNATNIDEPYHCNSQCKLCSAPCLRNESYGNAKACQLYCKDKLCSDSCDFISTMDSHFNPEPSSLPQTVFNIQVNQVSLAWSQKNNSFYSKNSTVQNKAVLFLLLIAQVDSLNFNLANEAQFPWKPALRSTSREVSVSRLRDLGALECNTSYVFKVAAVNKYGFNAYSPVTDVQSGSDLGLNDCVTWCTSIGNCRVPSHCGSQQNQTLLNLKNLNKNKNSLLSWNDNCFSPEATRTIKWNPVTELKGPFCYSVLMTASGKPPTCKTMKRLYFVPQNATELYLEKLKPTSFCTLHFLGIAGSGEASLSNSGLLEFKLNVPENPICESKYDEIDLNSTEFVFDPTALRYMSTISWKNPSQVPVSSFDVNVYLVLSRTGRRLQSEKTFSAINGLDYRYYYNVMLEPNQDYSVEVLCIHRTAGLSTIPLSFQTPALDPPPPVNLTVEPISRTTTLRVTWDIDIEDVHEFFPLQGFFITYFHTLKSSSGADRLVEEKSAVKIQINDSNVRAFEIQKLLPSTKYLIRVSAFTVDGRESDFAEAEQVTLTDEREAPFLTPIIVSTVCGVAVLVVIAVIISAHCVKNQKKQYLTRLRQFELSTYRPPRLAPCVDANEPTDEWELNPENLTPLELLGEGYFGVVLRGEIVRESSPSLPLPPPPRRLLSPRGRRNTSSCPDGRTTTIVACKMLKEDGTNEDQMELLKEIKLMKRIGQHANIVSMLCCITRTYPLCLVVEFCANGDLQSYLRAHRVSRFRKQAKETDGYIDMSVGSAAQTASESMSVKSKAPTEQSQPPKNEAQLDQITAKDILSFCHHVASGMHFLSARGLVHRDLACRNILVDENKIAKISDFGLTRAVYQDLTYTQKSRTRLPLKWMSIEAITDRVFTAASDVWSYGIVLWEICTLGGFPYPLVSNAELLSRLRKGYRMERPENCSNELYSIMLRCWHPEPDKRPLFSNLVSATDRMLAGNQHDVYVSLKFSADNVRWLSPTDLSDADSDAEPNVPFEMTALRQISFEDENFASLSSIALKAANAKDAEDEYVLPVRHAGNSTVDDEYVDMNQSANKSALQNGSNLASSITTSL